MMKKILIGLVAVVAVFVIVVAVQPSEFRVVRSATISAPASVPFTHVNDFRQWEAWSPWEKLDPNMKRVLGGSPSGVGASYFWSGNDEVGEGRMTIIESRPDEFIRIKLEFIKPFEMTSTTEFSFAPVGHQTEVKWMMYGENNFLGKAFCLFMDMDKAVGGDFEKGLAQMKSVTERSHPQ
jgi:hypothetical protein